jgi:hypothetical protein
MRFIKVKVIADANKNEVRPHGEDSFEVSVRSAPERGEANAQLSVLLGRHMGISPAKLRIVKGHRSKSKILEIWE